MTTLLIETYLAFGAALLAAVTNGLPAKRGRARQWPATPAPSGTWSWALS